ncbi:MAG TPA: response regulator transcription factor [Methylomirabilota bacterium]
MSRDGIVFVVDDDASVRRSLGVLIRSVGLESEAFPSAQAFLDHPLPDRPCCLVLDLRLPGPSGLDLQLALLKRTRTIPIIFISGHSDVPITARAMKGGAIDFLPKPFNDQDLLDAVQRALARDRQARVEAAERAVIERHIATLTPRERQVMLLVVRGLLNKQIAAELGAAEKTIKIHRGRMMQKMAAGSVAELVRMTEKLGLSA